MSHSEIDDIFAKKGKSNTASSSKAGKPAEIVEKPKKSKKKRKREAATDASTPAEDKSAEDRPSRRKAPETVVDPSIALSVQPKQKQPSKPAKLESTSKKRKRQNKEDEERFKDSRGTGPRRTTEEGFSIYKEDELGITEQGGDTPLCPFDCQCCF